MNCLFSHFVVIFATCFFFFKYNRLMLLLYLKSSNFFIITKSPMKHVEERYLYFMDFVNSLVPTRHFPRPNFCFCCLGVFFSLLHNNCLTQTSIPFSAQFPSHWNTIVLLMDQIHLTQFTTVSQQYCSLRVVKILKLAIWLWQVDSDLRKVMP